LTAGEQSLPPTLPRERRDEADLFYCLPAPDQ